MRPLKIHPAHVHAPECARWVTQAMFGNGAMFV